MLRFCFSFALCTGFLLAGAQNSSSKTGNPVFSGWYADPEGAIFNHSLWVFPTYSDKYEKQVFFDAFSTSDGVQWTKHPHILDTAAVKWAKKAMWAPAILKKDNLYYFFFSANDVHPGEVGGIGVAVASHPDGPFRDLLGKPVINSVENGAQPIDQFVFADKGIYYMIYGGWGHCNIVKLKPDFSGLLPFDDGTTFKEITPQGYVEGPVMFKRKEKYYFMWSEGGWGGPNYRVAYAMADSPTGPFQRIGTVLQQDSTVATSAGHHSVVHLPNNEWLIVYHRRPLGETAANHRVTCIDRMYFDDKGNIKPVKMTFEGVGRIKL
ncbi:glycoside hydrolase family 43 protein [Flavisolibacter ginsenosidimutans]|uniref:Family 43 glycosylhydrolase n=1 Tax=Flavisolibacter ginsenosidimutans TaxID=661481 RepID=A0A5B8UJK0_9BACT|nr:glycoside hydrolase family 43 protein [Flavisolibacter ginsenosidimutans]QEC56748.1 family 43 glycosylhydrolase [Flavisolibacter ginsenosidimutans]